MTGTQKPGIWLPLLVLVGAYFLVTAWNLHLQTIANPDEPRYAAAARTMLRGDDGQGWIIPYFNTQPRLVKPIAFYWLIAAAGAAGQAVGVSLDTALRCGPFLMGLLAMVGTFFLGARLRSVRYGVIAAVVLFTNGEFHKVSRELVVDMTLTAFVVWSWLFVHVALERIQNKERTMQNERQIEDRKSKIENPFLPLLGFYICLGMVCLTKGPFLVALFVVIPLLVYLAWSRRLRDLKHAGLWWGAPLSLLLGLWWSYAVYKSGHDAGSFFLTENIARAIGAKDHAQHPSPFIFYLETLGDNFAPWVVLLPFAIWWGVRQLWLARANTNSQQPIANSYTSGARFLLCILFVPFLFLGCSISKRPLYLLPLYPCISLALAWAWDEALLTREGVPAGKAWRGVMAGFGLLVLAGAIGCASQLKKLGGQPAEAVILVALCAAIAAGACLAAREMKHGRRWNASLFLLAMAVVVCFAGEAVARPITERAANRVEFYRALGEKLQGQPVVMVGLSSNEAVWYLDRPKEPLDDVRFPHLKARFFDTPGTKLLVSAKLLDKDAELKKVLKTEPLSVLYEGERYFLADPDPANPPGPEVFRTRAERESKAAGED